MAQYIIQIKDSQQNPVGPATITFLDAPGGSPILMQNQPVSFQTDATGNYTFTAAAPSVPVRISMTGYPSTDAVFSPGTNTVLLKPGNTGVVGPHTTIAPLANMPKINTVVNEHRDILMILAAVFLFYLAVKFNVLTA